MKAELRWQHEWLHALTGDWTIHAETPSTERVNAFGENWVRFEGHMPLPDGSAAHYSMTLGYNPESDQFVGSWIGTMMNHHWVYAGTLNEDKTTLTLFSHGPGFEATDGHIPYRDTIVLDGPDQRRLLSAFQNADGNWVQFMEVKYTR